MIPARRMHCDACARRIRRKLGTLDGVRAVDADAVRKEVLVAYEPARVSEERLRDELAALGFRRRPNDGRVRDVWGAAAGAARRVD